jgi:hypothetical protein
MTSEDFVEIAAQSAWEDHINNGPVEMLDISEKQFRYAFEKGWVSGAREIRYRLQLSEVFTKFVASLGRSRHADLRRSVTLSDLIAKAERCIVTVREREDRDA